MKLYRYSTNLFDSKDIIGYHQFGYDCVFLHSYDVIKETPCGGWIVKADQSKKFVNLRCVKQYASKSVDEAKAGFLARKQRHLAILKSQQMLVEESIKAIETEPTDYKSYITFDYGY